MKNKRIVTSMKIRKLRGIRYIFSSFGILSKKAMKKIFPNRSKAKKPIYLSIKTEAMASLRPIFFFMRRIFTTSPPIIPGKNILKKQPII